MELCVRVAALTKSEPFLMKVEEVFGTEDSLQFAIQINDVVYS